MRVGFNKGTVWASAALALFAALPCAAKSFTPEPDTASLLLCAFGFVGVGMGLARRNRTRPR